MSSLRPPPGGYGCIMSDPPWHFKKRTDAASDRDAPYSTMSLRDIAALPVDEWAARDCVLLLWATDPLLPDAFEVMRAWGFVYKTVGFYWVKQNRDGSPFAGLGYWTRANPETCLLGTRGRPARLSKSVRRVILSPRREHSRKPEEAYARASALVGGPYLDMFSRAPRPGWDQFGNECDKFG